MSNPRVTYSVKPAPVPGKVCVSQTTTHDEKLTHSTTMLMPPEEVPALFAALASHVDQGWRLAAAGLSEREWEVVCEALYDDSQATALSSPWRKECAVLHERLTAALKKG